MLNSNDLNILDLPDEILLIIFSKLTMADVLYSLVDVNERFNRLIFDPRYISTLDLTSMTMKSTSERRFSLNNHTLDRICQNILPRIHDQVNQLTIEQHSMKRILHNFNYPQLNSLSLIDFQAKQLREYLADDSILRNLLIQQITDLTIDIHISRTLLQLYSDLVFLFTWILSSCNRLITLNFCQSSRKRGYSIPIHWLLTRTCMSSTLKSLSIDVNTFDDCLYLLDGRLQSLSTLIIHVEDISLKSSSNIDNTKKLLKLKYLALTTYDRTRNYDNLVVPLLRRMINLEELILYLSIIRYDSTYVDGIQLYNDVLIYMPRLNKFEFSIEAMAFNEDVKIDLPSNEDIQHSFIGRGYGPVESYVHPTAPSKGISRCHVYSLPYQFQQFFYLNNAFKGGMCDKVQFLLITDIHPFEHDFFKIISRDFPFLQELCIKNNEPQKYKQQPSIPITFFHLTLLDLIYANVDYVEQFLFNTKSHLPRLMDLEIRYRSLAIVTDSFTNDAARLTCAKVKCLKIFEAFVRPENFDQYFPLL